MNDPFSPERKTVWLKKQNLFGSGYAGLGIPVPNSTSISYKTAGEPGKQAGES